MVRNKGYKAQDIRLVMYQTNISLCNASLHFNFSTGLPDENFNEKPNSA